MRCKGFGKGWKKIISYLLETKGYFGEDKKLQ